MRKEIFCLVLTLVVGQLSASGQVFEGDRGRVIVELGSEVRLQHPFPTHRSGPEVHPLETMSTSFGPGSGLDVHSKALLNWNRSIHVTPSIGDSVYLVRPGVPLIQLVYENRLRRSHLVPDSLFRIPETKRTRMVENLMDVGASRLQRYVQQSSRVVGAYRIELAGADHIAVLISHDWVREESGAIAASLALYTSGLFLVDLVHLPIEVDARVPIGSGPSEIWLKTGPAKIQPLTIKSLEPVERASGKAGASVVRQ